MPAILVKSVWIRGTKWETGGNSFPWAHESGSGEEFPETTGHLASAAESHSSHEVTRSSEEKSPGDSVLHKEEKQLN